MTNEIKNFIQFADIGLIQAIQTACRSNFPQTVGALDRLTDLDIQTIKRGGLKSLPAEKLTPIISAMEIDNFRC